MLFGCVTALFLTGCWLQREQPVPVVTAQQQYCADQLDALESKFVTFHLTCMKTMTNELCDAGETACIEEIQTFCRVTTKLQMMRLLRECEKRTQSV